MAITFKVDIKDKNLLSDYANIIRQFTRSRKVEIPTSIVKKAIPGAVLGKNFFNKKIIMTKQEAKSLLGTLDNTNKTSPEDIVKAPEAEDTTQLKEILNSMTN
jgi:hypothetical protein